MDEIDLKQMERRIFRQYVQDGLLELVLGVYLFVLGVALSAGRAGAFVVLVIVVPFLFRGLKKRLVYPRVGYVALREGDPGPAPRIILGALALGLLVLVGVLAAVGVLGDPAQWYSWMPIMFGIWLAGILLALGVTVRLIRYYVLAVIALVTGPIFALLPLTGKLENLGLFLATVGAVMLIWGLVVLLTFLHRHPVQDTEADHARS